MRLRIKPPLAGFIDRTDFVAEGPVPTDLAALAYKGGLPIEAVIALGQRVMKMKNVWCLILW